MVIINEQYQVISDGTQFILQKQVEAEKKDTKERNTSGKTMLATIQA